MSCLDKNIPKELWDILPKGLKLYSLELYYYLFYYGSEEGKVSISIEDIDLIEKKCKERNIRVKRLGSSRYRIQLHIEFGDKTWKIVSQSSSSSMDLNSNPTLYGYAKIV